MRQTVKIDPRLHIKKLEDILDEPKIIRVTDFSEEGLSDFDEEMAEAHKTGQPVIPVIVDSYGGEAYALLGMISLIENAKVPVATILTSKAMSAGALLFCFGHEGYRYMDPNATLMLHDVSSGFWGKVEEVKASAKQTEHLNQTIYTRVAKYLGHPQDYFLKLLVEKHHAEWYMTAKEAKKHNIANELRVPEFKIEIKLDVQFT